MADPDTRTIVVCGATGHQGGAVARHLISDGWKVRGLTRNPESAKAGALAETGVEVVKADMNDRASLDRAVAGAYGVYNVQNGMTNGFEAEVQQGKTVADAAKAAGVEHVVHGSAGIGTKSGVPSWDTKIEVEAHMRDIGLPLTVLRPYAFMELMSDSAYFPQVGTWNVMVKLAGGGTTIPWLAVDDLGAIAARVFGNRDAFVGRTIPIAGEVRSLDDARATWIEVFGKPPRRFPMPVWLFKRIAGNGGKDLPLMWSWLRANEIPDATGATHELHPAALTLRQWMERKKASAAA
jgi:uncharacterized protein YbjT (DUF2867 family)